MDYLTGRKKSRVKPVIIILLVLAAAAAAGFFIWKKFFDRPQEMPMDPGPHYDSVIRTDVERIYNAGGKIISAAEGHVGAGTSGETKYLVDEVMVKVGDVVHEGDILYTLDMTSLEEDIEIQKKKLALQQQAQAIDSGASQRALALAQAASGDQYTEATRNLIRKAQNINRSIIEQIRSYDDVQVYIDKEDRAKQTYETMKGDYEWLDVQEREYSKTISDLSAQLALLNQKKSYLFPPVIPSADSTGDDDKTTDGSTDNNSYVSSEEEIALTNQISDLKYSIAQAQYQKDLITAEMAKIDDARQAYEKAKSDRRDAQTALELIEAGVYDLEDIGTATDKGNRTVLEAEQAARDSIVKQGINNQISAIDTEKEIRRNLEMLEHGIVRATMDGTVTGVNISPGQTSTDKNAIILNNLEKMKVIADIDEGHIADISVGMPVRVRTDSTKEERITGRVIFTAPIPNEQVTSTQTRTETAAAPAQTSASASSKPVYRVEIELDDINDRLRVGMTAKIEFILEGSTDCLAVPSDFIMTDPEGNSFVRVVSDTGNPEDPSGQQAADEGAGETSPGASEGEGKGLTGESLGMPVREVKITTGVSDDYYTEITSGNIQEGDMVEGESAGPVTGGFGMLDGIY